MFQEKFNRLEDIEQVKQMDEFIVDFLEGWFYSTMDGSSTFGYMRETLEEMVLEAGMGALFLVPEEDDEINDEHRHHTIDIDDLA